MDMHKNKAMPSLWNWSLDVYKDASVASVCLHLQDRFDLDVNILLWLCYIAVHNRAPSAQTLARSLEISREWQEGWIQGVRKARRGLKRDDLEASQGLKERFLALELVMEKNQQAALQALPLLNDKRAAFILAQENLRSYMDICAVSDPACVELGDKLCALIVPTPD